MLFEICDLDTGIEVDEIEAKNEYRALKYWAEERNLTIRSACGFWVADHYVAVQAY